MEHVRLRESRDAPRLWRIAEQFSEARDAQKGNEDAYVAAEHCFAVLDGVSAQGSSNRVNNLTPGQFAVKIGTEILQDPSTDSTNVVERLTRALGETPGMHKLESPPSFVFAAFFPKEHVIVRVGDCSYLLDGDGSNPGLSVDNAKAVLRRRSLLKLRQKGYTDEQLLQDTTARDRLRDLKFWQENFSNNPNSPELGYGVMNGKEVPPQFIERIAVPADAKEIVLASDGYPPQTLHETFAETEAALRKLQLQDPLAIDVELGVRPHKPVEGQNATDDRTYLRIKR